MVVITTIQVSLLVQLVVELMQFYHNTIMILMIPVTTTVLPLLELPVILNLEMVMKKHRIRILTLMMHSLVLL